MASIYIDEDSPKNNSVCDNQQNFNKAYSKAVDHYLNKSTKLTTGQRVVMSLLLILQIAFIIWGIILALKMPPANRPVNVTLAILTGPIYVIAYYLSNIKKE